MKCNVKWRPGLTNAGDEQHNTAIHTVLYSPGPFEVSNLADSTPSMQWSVQDLLGSQNSCKQEVNEYKTLSRVDNKQHSGGREREREREKRNSTILHGSIACVSRTHPRNNSPLLYFTPFTVFTSVDASTILCQSKLEKPLHFIQRKRCLYAYIRRDNPRIVALSPKKSAEVSTQAKINLREAKSTKAKSNIALCLGGPVSAKTRTIFDNDAKSAKDYCEDIDRLLTTFST